MHAREPQASRVARRFWARLRVAFARLQLQARGHRQQRVRHRQAQHASCGAGQAFDKRRTRLRHCCGCLSCASRVRDAALPPGLQ